MMLHFSPRRASWWMVAVIMLALAIIPSTNILASTNTFSGGGITIPDNASGTPYPSTITVSGITGTVTKVTVTLSNMSHTFPDDVDVLLVGPGNKKVMLMSDAGGDPDISGVTLT